MVVEMVFENVFNCLFEFFERVVMVQMKTVPKIPFQSFCIYFCTGTICFCKTGTKAFYRQICYFWLSTNHPI
jgi:hypothetical protein